MIYISYLRWKGAKNANPFFGEVHDMESFLKQIPAGGIALALCLLLLSLVVSGCLSQSQPAQSPSAQNSTWQGSGNVSVGDSRTGVEKTQATIASIVPDGAYEKTMTYPYHSGNTTVDFRLTVQGDIITSASAEGVNAGNISTMIIGKFNGALPELVVGKKINELNIPKNVAGSSLTTAAFKQYVEGLTAGAS